MPANRQGNYASLALGSANMGTTSGAAVAALIHKTFEEPTVLAWAWRIPFLAGILIGLLAFWVERRLPAREAVKDPSPNPAKDVLRFHRLELFLAFVISSFWSLGIYTNVIWLVTLNSVLLTPALPSAHVINGCCMLVMVAMINIWGRVADRIGVTRVLLFGCFYSAVVVFPAGALLSMHTPLSCVVAQLLLAVGVAAYGSVLPICLATHFPPAVRYTGVAISYNISQAMFGGTAPLIQTGLYNAYPEKCIGPALFYSAVAIASGLGILFSKFSKSNVGHFSIS